MNILLIDPMPELEHVLRCQGHELMVLRLGPGVFHLPGILRHAEFAPDLVFQQECLGPRAFFGGLDTLDCPTAFWAVDSHLNMFWQQWYALLFDAVLTPHVSLFRALPAGRRPCELRRFAWPGQRRQWVPHKQRGHALSLCARLDAHRPVRGWLAELLGPAGLYLTSGLGMAEMMRLYDGSRMVANECIANEVNFRLLEGASSGCMVLSPDVGEDQDALLLPDKEFLVYRDGLELLERIAWAKKHPEAAEAVGRAAMLRVQAEHLPEHRAAALPRLAKGLSQNRLTGRAAALAFWIVLALQIRNQRMDLAPHDHARQGLRLAYSLPPWPELPPDLRPLVSQTIAQSLCLFAEKSRLAGIADASAGPDLLPGGGVAWPVDEAVRLCRNLLAESGRAGEQQDSPPVQEGASSVLSVSEPSVFDPAASGPFPAFGREDSLPARRQAGAEGGDGPALYGCSHPAGTLELASAASAFALRQGSFNQALAFWLRYAGKDGKSLPRDSASLCLRWATAWEERGVVYNSGSGFVPEKGFLPECALHYLTFAQTLDPNAARPLARQSATMLAGRRDLLSLRIGYLADVCLAEPDNWRMQLEYGLECLRGCRVEAGMFEVEEARAKADREGKIRLFQSGLIARPGGRRVWEALTGRGEE